ncbi:MAG: nucleotidyltransferase family protein [Clostridium sp.]
MKKVENLTIKNDVSIRDALKKIDEEGKRIVFVVDNDKKFIGTITDGDVRRWILKNGSMDESVMNVVSKSAKFLYEDEIEKARELMNKECITAVPVLKRDNTICDAKFLFEEEETKENLGLKGIPVIIMAGGLGTRLYPYTKILPKPLIPIGDTPILERIIDKFNKFGSDEFFLTVNYKKNMIKSYFNELDKSYSVNYVEEDKPLGTGGSLSLLKGKINSTFFVSNCDIIIEDDYQEILEHHKKSKNKITVVASVKNFTIPYGVFNLNNNGSIKSIQEKPEYSYLINTGMYILEPEVLNDIPDNTFYNLPDILEEYMNQDVKVGVYPISEQSWMDMGQISEMKDMVERIEKKEKNNQ